jgi:hypothetical protein
MRSRTLVVCFAAAIPVLAVMGGCDRRENRPLPGPGPTPQPRIVGLEINGPGSIAPGQVAQFTAISRFSDGGAEPADGVRWLSQYKLFHVDPSGLVTAGDRTGEDTLIVEVNAPSGLLRALKEILILPDGTYRMVGSVTEAVPPGTPIVGARIEVTPTPIAAVTNWDGRYVLYGVPASAVVHVARDGYQPLVQHLQLGEHTRRDFQLELSGTRLDLTGTYTLTVDAACATSTPVSEDLRHPRYAASITQSGPALQVVLTETERFKVNGAGRGDRFTGRVDTVTASFDLGDNFFLYYPNYDPSSYPTIVERIPDGRVLVLDGKALVRISATGLAGDLDGFFIGYAAFPTFPMRALGSCYSSTHRFTLTRR